jgi:hypothetical protein
MVQVLDLSKEIGKAAKTVSFAWPGVVEADDIEQDIYLHLLERPGSLEKLLTFDDKGKLNALIQIGHQIAKQERIDYEVFSGNFRYSVDEVRNILEDRGLHGDDPALKSSWSVAEDFTTGGEFEDAVLNKSAQETDLVRAMERLSRNNPHHTDLINRRYLAGESLNDADRKELYRALTALTTEMNRSFKRQHAERPDGPGTRKAVRSETAHYMSKSNWDDESSEAVNRLRAHGKASGL